MPHVAFVPFTGYRIREPELLELGLRLPGLSRRAAAVGALPALGPLTLAGMTPDAWSRSWHEASPGLDVLEAVLSARPTLVAISALTASALDAYAFARRVREAGVQVVLGGLHATALPDEARATCAVVVGEGEPVWERVLRDAEAGALEQYYQADAPFDLTQSPLPDYSLLGDAPRPRHTLQTQRGCPFACEFCAASRLLGPFREKPLSVIERELEAISQRDPRPRIELADDNTFAGARDPGPLLDLLGASKARWFTEADWRIGERPEVLERLASSGCAQVLVGLESLVTRYRGMGAKDVERERAFDAVRAIQEAGVPVNACFVAGADGETRETLENLGAVLEGAPFADVQLTLQTPFPGTALRKRLARTGRLLEDRGWDHYTLFDVTYQPDSLSVLDLERGFREVIQQVFSPDATARRDRLRRAILRRRREAQ